MVQNHSFIWPLSVIGFSRNALSTVEKYQPLDNVHVQFYSGANSSTLEYGEVQFSVKVSGEGSATQGMLSSS